ncbi:MAG: hypothetical protein MJY82_08345 [Fibrobacter sp.]|nr:hypothetical protein [Fibrobacter sp.]
MKRLALLVVAALLFTSCANKSMTRYETLAPTLEKKGFEATISEVKKQKEDLYGSNSEFLYYYDLGVLNHYNRNFDESIKNLAQAEKIYEDLYTKSISNEAAAIVTNDNVRPYRARPFELLTLYQFQILNYLAKMDLDGALVEVKRSQIAMNALYQKDQDKVNDNGFLRYLSALVYDLDDEKDDAAISYYKAIKAYDESKMGVPNEVFEFVTESLRRMDREDDIRALKKKELESTPKATAVQEKGQEIVVIGYAGHSPILGEMYLSGTFVSGGVMNLYYKDGETGKKHDLVIAAPPVAGAGSETFHIGFALPEVRDHKSSVNQFEVSLDGKTRLKPEKVMAVDEELKRNMEDEKTSTIVRTAVRVILRTIAAQKAKSATNTGNGLFDLVKNIGVDVAQGQLEQADLRVGLFLPNSFYMTRLPVDAGSHSVSVAAQGPHGETIGVYNFDNIAVKKGQKVFLIVPAIK